VKLFWLIAILLSACTPMKPLPPADPCTTLSSCEEVRHAGIPASKTVQLMLQAPALIGGKPAEPAEWPASVYAKYGSSACSATVVGERVLFIASHCTANGGTVQFAVGTNQYRARCTHHPEYKPNAQDTADWSLCVVDRPVTGVPFEVLATKIMLQPNQQLLLSGYGCTNPGGGGGNDGIFRIGHAKIISLPYAKNYDIVTVGGAALCYGDSGGAAYFFPQTNGQGPRYIVGVNSRGNIEDTSYLSAVFAKTFVTWAEAWAKANGGAKICGLHADAAGCRSGGAAAPVDGKFEIAGRRACLKGVVKPEFLSKKQEIVDGLKGLVEASQ
jgi:hypothetical protein